MGNIQESTFSNGQAGAFPLDFLVHGYPILLLADHNRKIETLKVES